MGEIINPVISLQDIRTGDTYHLITEDHTIADIARWLVKEGWWQEVVYIINEITADMEEGVK